MFLDGDAPEIRDPEELQTKDDDFFLVLNAHHEPVDFRLPRMSRFKWTVYVTTAPGIPVRDGRAVALGLTIGGRSILLLRHKAPPARAKERP